MIGERFTSMEQGDLLLNRMLGNRENLSALIAGGQKK